MTGRKKELIFATLIYFVTMFTLLTAVYRFLETWHLSAFNFFIAGALVLLIAVIWGYILTALIFAPKKQMEDTLTSLTNDIIHELNIPLSTIKANTAMLKKSMDDEKSLRVSLNSLSSSNTSIRANPFPLFIVLSMIIPQNYLQDMPISCYNLSSKCAQRKNY